jgi:hypothetical protein
MQSPKAAQQPHRHAELSSELEHRTTTAGGPQRSNSALVSDACESALLRRASFSAPQRER